MMISKMPNGTPEIYAAIQGEGKTIGVPLIFVRLATCNLMCTWCDTFYTWNFDNLKRPNPHQKAPVKREDYVMQMSVEQVVERISNIKCKNVTFTGGEPTLQQKDNLSVLSALREKDASYYFETETNGTLKLEDSYLAALNQINCSPKLASSGNKLQIRSQPKVIQQIRDSGKGTFKFVVVEENWQKDLIEIQNWQKENNVPNSMIYLMPEGVESQRILEGTRFLMEQFLESGYNISTRLHILLFENLRAI